MFAFRIGIVSFVFFLANGYPGAVAFETPVASSKISHIDKNIPLTLDHVVTIALTNNPSLSARRNALSSSVLSLASAQSDFEIQIAPTGGAGISAGDDGDASSYYTAGVALSKKFTTGSRVEVTPTIGWEENDGSTRQNSLGIQLTQPLFRGISPAFNRSAIRSAELNVRSARRSYFLGQVDIFIQTVSGFYDILLHKKLVENHRQSVTRLRAFARTAGIKRKIGLAGPEDEFRANQNLQQARDDLVAVEQALELALDNLKRLLDWPVSRPIQLDGDLTVTPVFPDESETVAAALENRVEIDAARDILEESRSLSRDARHRLLPRLDISLAYRAYDRASPLDQDLNENQWGISLTTSSDIFRRTEKTAYKQSLLAMADAERNLSILEEDIVRQVRESIRNLNEAASRIELQKTRAEDAEKQLSLSRFKFKYGMTDNFNLIDAESVLNNAQGNVHRAEVQYIVGVYRLRAAMGTLIQNPERVP